MNNSLNGTDTETNAPPETVFSTIVTAISGARQTANQEFNRFWDKLTNNNGYAQTNGRHQPPHHRIPTTFGTEGDLARIEAGKAIHGRLVPDNHRRIDYIKNAEIQTLDNTNFSVKRKSSILNEDEDETIDRPKKISRKEYTTSTFQREPSVKPLPQLTQQSLFTESLPPSTTSASDLSDNKVDLSVVSPVRESTRRIPSYTFSPTRATSPHRASPIRASTPISNSPVSSSPFKTSSFRASPAQSPDSQIKTGSSKSVKRLTFELEEAFSPRFPLPVGYTRKQSTTSDSSDPFHSTPLIKNNIAPTVKADPSPIRESKSEDTKTTSFIDRDAPTESITKVDYSSTTPSESTTKVNHGAASPDDSITQINHSIPFETKQAKKFVSFIGDLLGTNHHKSTSPQLTSPSQKSPSRRLDQEEEDRRIEELERNVSTIKSQMNSYVSYPSIRSPQPSHTITADISNNTTTSYKHNYSVSPQEKQKVLSPIRSTFEVSTASKFTGSTSPQTVASSSPYRFTGSFSPLRTPIGVSTLSSSSRSPTTVKATVTSQPSSPYKVVSKSPNNNANTPPPPAPPVPPLANIAEIPKTFSPVRDIPNAFLTKRFRPSTSYSPPNSIKESQLAPFSGPNIAINDKTPLKPSDEHKSTMRELIQLIPGVKLRKTDKIIGPDGKERPNPFWNEIYNRGGRRVY